MMTWILVGGLSAIALLVGLAIYAAYRAGGQDEYDRGYADGRQAKLTEDREARAVKAGRHRASQPRADLPLQPAAVTPDPKPRVRDWYRKIPARGPGPVELPSGGAIGIMVARHGTAAQKRRVKPAVTAESIATVLLAPSPAPAKNGAADTGTMTRVKLSPDPDTGEMKAVTDAWIAEHIHPEAVL